MSSAVDRQWDRLEDERKWRQLYYVSLLLRDAKSPKAKRMAHADLMAVLRDLEHDPDERDPE